MHQYTTDDYYDPEAEDAGGYDDDEEEWVLAKITDRRGPPGAALHRCKYKCLWVGYGDEATWETRDRLVGLGYLSAMAAWDKEAARKATARIRAAQEKARALTQARAERDAENFRGTRLSSQLAEFQQEVAGRPMSVRMAVLESHFPQLASVYRSHTHSLDVAMHPRDVALGVRVQRILEAPTSALAYGTKVMSTGTYTGYWMGGQRHGTGEFRWHSGSFVSYQGEWRNGHMCGSGILRYLTLKRQDDIDLTASDRGEVAVIAAEWEADMQRRSRREVRRRRLSSDPAPAAGADLDVVVTQEERYSFKTATTLRTQLSGDFRNGKAEGRGVLEMIRTVTVHAVVLEADVASALPGPASAIEDGDHPPVAEPPAAQPTDGSPASKANTVAGKTKRRPEDDEDEDEDMVHDRMKDIREWDGGEDRRVTVAAAAAAATGPLLVVETVFSLTGHFSGGSASSRAPLELTSCTTQTCSGGPGGTSVSTDAREAKAKVRLEPTQSIPIPDIRGAFVCSPMTCDRAQEFLTALCHDDAGQVHDQVFDNGLYTGETLCGRRHGHGRYVWTDTQHVYEGEWAENNMHGRGVYTWTDGRRYTGRFHKGDMHGLGKYELGDGSYFDGQFRFDLIDGPGVYVDDKGKELVVVWRQIHPLDAVFIATPAFQGSDPETPAWVADRASRRTQHEDPRTAAVAVPSDAAPASLLTDPGVDPACVICQDERKTRAVVPCGHMCICEECAATGKVTMCPLCRVPAETLLRLYV